MARLNGVIDIEGTLGGLTYYTIKGKEGTFVRGKGGVSTTRLKKGKEYAKFREYQRFFKYMSASARLIRESFDGLRTESWGGTIVARMNGLMQKMVKLDGKGNYEKAVLVNAMYDPRAVKLLMGFNFNQGKNLDQLIRSSYTVDGNAGLISFNHAVAAHSFSAPRGATHVSLKARAVRMDFVKQDFKFKDSKEARIPLKGKQTLPDLQIPRIPKGPGPCFILLRVSFYEESNGQVNLITEGGGARVAIVG